MQSIVLSAKAISLNISYVNLYLENTLYYKNEPNIISMQPVNKPIPMYLYSLYFKALGNSSCIDKVIIMPATNINIKLINL